MDNYWQALYRRMAVDLPRIRCTFYFQLLLRARPCIASGRAISQRSQTKNRTTARRFLTFGLFFFFLARETPHLIGSNRNNQQCDGYEHRP